MFFEDTNELIDEMNQTKYDVELAFNRDLDDKVEVTAKFIRNKPDSSVEECLKWLDDCFHDWVDKESVSVVHICDICGEEYKSMQNMNTVQCTECMKYFDYCKSHDNVTNCPFCKYKI